MRFLAFFSGVFLLSTGLFAQSGFTLPLREKVFLTGNYGEIRPNHFHAGLDFRTDIEKHLPIYCIGDGYVSRIKVGTHGYGKVLYITHPNGQVSVYGHQYRFNDSIKKYVEAAQDMLEAFEVELFPKPGELKVKQGELIGYTGNTGDTEGPHLHFEIRDEKTEVPLNPLRFLSVPDTVAPVITAVTLRGGEPDYVKYLTAKDTTDTLRVPLSFGVGVQCHDLEQIPGNANNVNKIELVIDSNLYYRAVLDSIPFDMARYVNCYAWRKRFKIRWQEERYDKEQKCFKMKNNDLPIYKVMNGDGYINLNDTLVHELKIIVYDLYDHACTLKIKVKREPASRMNPVIKPPVNCLEPWQRSTANYRIEMLEKTLYTDVRMTDSMHNGWLHFYADGYNLPLHKSCILAMKVPAHLKSWAHKLCIADVSGAYYGGAFDKDWISTTTKSFGMYKVAIDTIAPAVKFVKPRSKKKKVYKAGDLISFKVNDALSGIGNFKVLVNDKFQLAEYEHKTGLVFFEVTDKTPKGKITVKLQLSDKKDNQAVNSVTIDVE